MKSLIEQINEISDEYFEKSQELADIAARKGTAWLEIKKEHNVTNAEADRIWESMPDGSRERYLTIYLRGLEKKRGALVLEYKAGAGTNFI